MSFLETKRKDYIQNEKDYDEMDAYCHDGGSNGRLVSTSQCESGVYAPMVARCDGEPRRTAGAVLL